MLDVDASKFWLAKIATIIVTRHSFVHDCTNFTNFVITIPIDIREIRVTLIMN